LAPLERRRFDVNTTNMVWGLFGLGFGCWACVPSGGPGDARAPQTKPAPPVEAELKAAPPTAVESKAAGAPFLAAPAEPNGPLVCVQPTDPELDKESSWSKELGRMIERQLPRLRACSLDLPPEDEGQITLRLVYRKDGSAVSQHVVTSTSNACAASECLKRELSSIEAPELLIERAALDLTLRLERDAVPTRLTDPVDPLTPDESTVSVGGCVDDEIARLSQAKVREVVTTTYDQLQACYGEALMRDHAATGKVTFEFVIGQNGRISDAWASDATLRDCAAIECMLSQFRALSFPEPVGRSVRVIYPISYVVEQSPVTLR
jgi:hypothetical protein